MQSELHYIRCNQNYVTFNTIRKILNWIFSIELFKILTSVPLDPKKEIFFLFNKIKRNLNKLFLVALNVI